MKQQDKIIKKVLQSKMQYLDDEQFTNRLIYQHHQRKKSEYKISFDFKSLIAGLVCALIFFGLGIIVESDFNIGLTMHHVMILIALSVFFLIYRLLGELAIKS